MSSLSIRTDSGHFNWDYLSGSDLVFPQNEHFRRYNVYKGGEVHQKNAGFSELHRFCVAQKMIQDGASKPELVLRFLKDSGYLVEALPMENEFRAARQQYNAEMSKRQEEFRQALFEQEGVVGNPKADVCYDKAYEAGHSEGWRAVAAKFIDLVELIR